MAKLAYDMSPAEQRAVLAAHKQRFNIDFGGPQVFTKPEWKHNIQAAMDAQPTLVTTPNSGIPAFLTYFTDPDILRILTAKNQAAEIFTEELKGDWTSTELYFPVVERTYQVSSYGDFNNNGTSGINTNFPTREPYLYQITLEYGNLEMDRAGLAKINLASEMKEAAIDGLNKFGNLTYFYGVAGLRNYGILNDPSMYPFIAPAPKTNGGIAWMNGNTINATANEIFADIQASVAQLIQQSAGQVDLNSKLVLAMSPRSQNAMTATNSFNVNVAKLLENNYPNLEVKTAIQYGAYSAQNPQGSLIGETVQLWCPEVQGQKSGFCSFNSKLQAGPIIPALSSFTQKLHQGSSGFILKQPFAMSTLIGV